MNTLNCFWNASPAKCVPITYKVSQVPSPHWQNAFVGERRQGLIMMPDNANAFVIDNNAGDGWAKVADKLTAHYFEHKPVINPIDVSFDVEHIRTYDDYTLLEDNTRIHEYFTKQHPELFTQ